MIRAEKYNLALRALHEILVDARAMAASAGFKQLSGLMDAAEILPKYIAQPEDQTEIFRLSLQGIAERFPECRRALRVFTEPYPSDW